MLRFTTSLVTAIILLSGSVWAQVCPTRIPPGHYYCNTHNEICTHGLSTPAVVYRPNRVVVVRDQFGNRYRPANRVKQANRRHRKAQRKQARRNARICR
jgi:hypothetical protein